MYSHVAIGGLCKKMTVIDDQRNSAGISVSDAQRNSAGIYVSNACVSSTVVWFRCSAK